MIPGTHLFTIFRTPVHAEWTFGLLLFILSRREFDRGWEMVFVTCLAVFVSLLVHEFGHVYAARTNGYRSFVVLGGMGAYTMPEGESEGWRGIWLSAAGPLFGFLLWAICWFGFAPTELREAGLLLDWRAMLSPVAAYMSTVPEQGWQVGHHLWALLCFFNLIWGIFNLLPIFPLDGGQIVRRGLKMRMRGGEAERISAVTSLVVVVLAALLIFRLFGTSILAIVVLGFLGFANLSRLQAR